MSEQTFDISEFIEKKETPSAEREEGLFEQEGEIGEEEIAEVDIQKAVVEELAAEKIELHEKVSAKEEELQALSEKIKSAELALEEAKKEAEAKKQELEDAKKIACELKENLAQAKEAIRKLDEKLSEKFFARLEVLERNPNMLALLDREPELEDRYLGETRDHVLEVIQQARDAAEKEGRQRRAQILESVLVANEPAGELKKRREMLENLFKENSNLLTGSAMKKLDELNIKYKEGEGYLMPSEIILRNF